MAVFFMATMVHVGYALLIWFIVPESLTKAQRRQSRAKYVREKAEGGRGSLIKRVFPLAPISLILPQKVVSANGMKYRRDWNLTIVFS